MATQNIFGRRRIALQGGQKLRCARPYQMAPQKLADISFAVVKTDIQDVGPILWSGKG